MRPIGVKPSLAITTRMFSQAMAIEYSPKPFTPNAYTPTGITAKVSPAAASRGNRLNGADCILTSAVGAEAAAEENSLQ